MNLLLHLLIAVATEDAGDLLYRFTWKWLRSTTSIKNTARYIGVFRQHSWFSRLVWVSLTKINSSSLRLFPVAAESWFEPALNQLWTNFLKISVGFRLQWNFFGALPTMQNFVLSPLLTDSLSVKELHFVGDLLMLLWKVSKTEKRLIVISKSGNPADQDFCRNMNSLCRFPFNANF